MKNYHELDNETVLEVFNDILSKKFIPIEIKFQFMAVVKSKKLIMLKKVPDNLEPLINTQIQVIVNESIFEQLDEKSIEILFEQEIEKISCNMETGKISLSRPKIVAFPGIISKYGIDDVSRAFEIEEIASKPKKETE